MITFDLVNERKIEVRRNLLVLPKLNEAWLFQARNPKQSIAGKNTNNGRTDGRRYQFKFRRYTQGHEEAMFTILHNLLSLLLNECGGLLYELVKH